MKPLTAWLALATRSHMQNIYQCRLLNIPDSIRAIRVCTKQMQNDHAAASKPRTSNSPFKPSTFYLSSLLSLQDNQVRIHGLARRVESLPFYRCGQCCIRFEVSWLYHLVL